MRNVVVFVSGPYRAPTISGVRKNIETARRVSETIATCFNDLKPWRILHYCPHLNSAFMDGLRDDEYWLEHSLEMLHRSDVVFGYFPSWSEGSCGEISEAIRLGKPVVEISERAWLQGGEEVTWDGWDVTDYLHCLEGKIETLLRREGTT